MIWPFHFTKPAKPSRSARLLAMTFLWLAAVTSSQAAPVVGNVQASQRAGTKLVDITYDVTADTPTVTVSSASPTTAEPPTTSPPPPSPATSARASRWSKQNHRLECRSGLGGEF
jgi:hypothetical protein